MTVFSKSSLAAAAIAALPIFASLPVTAAWADEVRLDKPATGATLHGNDVDMSVYFTENETGDFILVATYLGKTSHDAPGRLVMALSDGEKVQFGLPGKRGSIYLIAREGDSVTIADRPAAGRFDS